MAAIHPPVCEFGRKLPAFSLPDPYGRQYIAAELMRKSGLLVMFICNHCPFVKAILPDLIDTAKQLQSVDVGIVAIMSNNWDEYPEDSPQNMRQLIESHNISFPYLVDEEQTVAKEFGAVCTPDFFGYNHKGELQYRGRFDGRGMGNTKLASHENDLLNAMLQVAQTGHGPKQQIASIGCSIKWKEY